LAQDAELSEGYWLWNPVDVPAGQYSLVMQSFDNQQYDIVGESALFTVGLADTSCLNSSSASSSSPPTQSSPPPSTSSPNQSSSASSSVNTTPSAISAVSHSSVGLKAGVSVAVIAVFITGVGALFWVLYGRWKRSSRLPNNPGDRGPRYDDLGSRDDYPSYPKSSNDPLSGGAVSSYWDEKSGQSTNAISSHNATTGHGGVDSVSAISYIPPSMPSTANYNNNIHPVVLVGRSLSGSTSSRDSALSIEAQDLETTTTQSSGVQHPKRAARKPVPAYGDLQRARDSEERKSRSRSSANSLSMPATDTGSFKQIGEEIPNTVKHKGSFGETKPMSHVLMPDLPLARN
jgi:hypothetical protein